MGDRIKFPHVLTMPKQSNGNLLRFVTDETIGERLIDRDRSQHNPDTQTQENVYNVFQITEVKEKRKAKGDWKNWPQHPTYYATTGTYLGNQFESNLGTDNFINR